MDGDDKHKEAFARAVDTVRVRGGDELPGGGGSSFIAASSLPHVVSNRYVDLIL